MEDDDLEEFVFQLSDPRDFIVDDSLDVDYVVLSLIEDQDWDTLHDMGFGDYYSD